MAWVERHGRKWRVRYWRDHGVTGSISGFSTEEAARAYADQMSPAPPTPATPPTPPTPATSAEPSPPPQRTAAGTPNVVGPTTAPQPSPAASGRAGQVTVAQWAETWWQTIDVGANTEAFYRTLLTRHILPQWGSTPLTGLTPAGIKIWLKQLRSTYAHTTVQSIRKLLGMILNDAVDNDLIDRSPVRPDHRGRGRLEPRQEKTWIDEHQLLTIARRVLRLSCRNHCLLVITAAYTGMR